MVRRADSVGWAVRTGRTSSVRSARATASAAWPASRKRRSDQRTDPRCAAARSSWRARRTRWACSAALIRMKNTVKARAVRRAVSGGSDRVRASSASRSGAPATPSRRARQARRRSSTACKASAPARRPTTRPKVPASQRTSWRSGASCGRATGGGSGTVAAAALAAHPDGALRFYNRGVSGDKVPDLTSRWATDTLPLEPDVLSILVGVNDFWHKLSKGYTGTVQQYEDQYVALLEQTRRALPRVRVLVLEPFVLRCGAVDEHWFPEFDERRAAARRVAQRAGASFVPLQAVFDDLSRRATPQYWAADGVHPTPAGHALLAEQWRRPGHP